MQPLIFLCVQRFTFMFQTILQYYPAVDSPIGYESYNADDSPSPYKYTIKYIYEVLCIITSSLRLIEH